MRIRYYFTVFCVCLTFGLGVFLLASCGAEDVDLSAHEEVKLAAAPPLILEEPVLERQEEIAEVEDVPLPEVLALKMKEGADFILDSYRDPELREDVIDFFGELSGSQDIAEAVLFHASELDISPALAFALCYEESRFNLRAVNHNRNKTVDRGLFQLNSGSFPKLKTEDFFDIKVNARHGLSHLRWCLHTAGTEVAALAMYNAGTHRVRSAGTPKTTLDYISRILKRRQKIEELFSTVAANLAEAAEAENAVHETNNDKKLSFSLSLLSPLGR